MVSPSDVIDFWLDEVGPKGWYNASSKLDDAIRTRFLETWQTAQEEGGLGSWLINPDGCLAFIILTDQFPRNMFRGTDKSFATDRHARAVAKMAISRDWDLQIPEPQRQFFYTPLEHSESQCDQNRAVRLIKTRLPETQSALLHATAHREVIRLFGRFPYRNNALGRTTTKAEQDWLSGGAYGSVVRNLQGAMAAQ